MTYTFDGTNKIISISSPPVSGAIGVDVRDLYSRWIDWTYISDNSKYLQAFRSVGGDPLPGSKQLGLTYFLMNNWKIRPYEGNHVFTLNGNLYSEDGSSPYVATIGSYNVTIINSVSNLVDSTVQQLPEIEYASYNGGVTIDTINGTDSSEYPYGTPKYPCKTATNSATIRATRGFDTIYLKSDLNLTDLPDSQLNNLKIIAVTGFRLHTLTITNCLVTNCIAENLNITGVFKEGSTAEVRNCDVHNADDIILTAKDSTIHGGKYCGADLTNCSLDGDIDLDTEAYPVVFSGVGIVFEGDYTTITHNSVDSTISLDISSGYVNIKNSTVGCLSEFNLRGGEIEIDQTCTGGEFYIEGYGTLYGDPETFGMTVKANHLIALETIPEPIWNSLVSDYQTPGTTGKALSNASSAGDPWSAELPGSYVEGQAGYELTAMMGKTDELHLLQGLDPLEPMTVTNNSRKAGHLNLEITGDGTTTSTVTRI